MSTDTRMNRRTLIKGAAVAGATAWTAPVIIDSLMSPAAAQSGGFPCSYASIVFTKNGAGPYAVKIDHFATTCTITNETSGDNTFTASCNGTYSNTCSGNTICFDGSAVPASSVGCPFTVSGGNVTAQAGVSILFVAVHDGSFANHFQTLCAPGSSFDVGASACSGV